MASKVSLLLAFFLLFSGCLAYHQQQRPWLQQQNQCQIQRIDALEPYDVIQAEAGVTEFWDASNQQFQCAGVDFIRHRIQPGGLLLPSYVNAPLLSFTERGRGVQGVVLPGCPETFEDSSEQQFSGQGERRGQRLQDRHQKVENLNEGDVAAIPAGAAHWIYNNGDSELVVVVFFDVQNYANQLDQNRRRFFLAGNPQAQSQQQHGQRQPRREEQGQSQSRREEHGQRQPHREEYGWGQQEKPHRNADNIFNGFGIDFIAEAFNVDYETAEKLRGQNDDQRGHIVNVERDLQIVQPSQSRERQQRRHAGGRSNGFEETICSLKLKENIDNPSHSDFANPEAGRITNLNRFKFPVLRQLQLSVERGELHRNAIHSPHWTLNAHNLLYVTDGTLRVQIVNNKGDSVFDDELREGQVVVIPQNFAVIKKASEQTARWVSFRTNDNAMTSHLAGRISAIRSLPADVLATSYRFTREDAQKLKFNQQQAILLAPSSSRCQGRGRASA